MSIPNAPDAEFRHWDESCELPLPHKPGPFALVLFGATGDLARRSLLPSLYSLVCQGLLSEPFALVAFARRAGDDETFRAYVRDAIHEFAPALPIDGPVWEAFAGSIYYHRSEMDDEAGYKRLDERLVKLDAEKGLKGNRLFYLAIPPDHFLQVVTLLGSGGLVAGAAAENEAWSRVIIEKPFGFDLESARALNSGLRKVFSESQIFRIDHYLGKETVQNILVMRFANKLFELIWNQAVIDNVQITVAETLGMEGRGEYFDSAGVSRDIIQNHALQILTLVAMEPPINLEADSVRDEKVKVLKAIRPFTKSSVATDAVRGQYTDGIIHNPGKDDDHALAYTREEGVKAHSRTETFAAIRFQVDNWRWAGVPFYIRAGKRLPTRATEINIQLKAMPDVLFARMQCVHVLPNRLTLRIQPNEGIMLQMSAKPPGPRMQVRPVEMLFCYAEEFATAIPDAYERLILDAVLGEAALFARSDEVEAAWGILEPILNEWKASPNPPEPYFAGSWGPRAANDLLRKTGRHWHNPGQEDG